MFEMDNPKIFVNPVSIPDIINSLFFWKDVYADKNPFSDALDESIAALLPLNDLLINIEWEEQANRIKLNNNSIKGE